MGWGTEYDAYFAGQIIFSLSDWAFGIEICGEYFQKSLITINFCIIYPSVINHCSFYYKAQ